MWIQRENTIASGALMFSLIFHLAIFISLFISNEELSSKPHPASKMQIILVPTSTETTKTTTNTLPINATQTLISPATQQSHETTNQNSVPKNYPDIIEEASHSVLTEKFYDPLIDAKNRAKQAVAEAKNIADLHKKSIKELDSTLIEQIENQDTDDNHTTLHENNLYKLEIISSSEKKGKHSIAIDQESLYISEMDNKNKFDKLKEQVKTLLDTHILPNVENSDTILTFTVDPQNLIILIEIFSSSVEIERNLNPLIKQLNFDSIFINSTLNDMPYSFSVKFNDE